MSLNHHLPKKIEFKAKKHHGFLFVIMICGFFVPPLAVAIRFGIGRDFFINCFLCICGYIPSHFHNFYIQNIRNNTGRGRTPKWAKKAGLVDDSEDKRKARKSQWAKRYDERNARSAHEDAELAEGEEGENYRPSSLSPEEVARRKREGLWTREDEEFYNEDRVDEAPNQRHWHYPANFEGTDADMPGGRDHHHDDTDGRWRGGADAHDSERTGIFGKKSKKSASKANKYAAYAPESSTYGDNNFDSGRSNNPLDAAYDDDVPEWGRDYGAPKGGASRTAGGGGGGGGGRGRSATGDSSSYAGDSTYGRSTNGNPFTNGIGNGNGNGNGNGAAKIGGGRSEAQENWDHQF